MPGLKRIMYPPVYPLQNCSVHLSLTTSMMSQPDWGWVEGEGCDEDELNAASSVTESQLESDDKSDGEGVRCCIWAPVVNPIYMDDKAGRPGEKWGPGVPGLKSSTAYGQVGVGRMEWWSLQVDYCHLGDGVLGELGSLSMAILQSCNKKGKGQSLLTWSCM